MTSVYIFGLSMFISNRFRLILYRPIWKYISTVSAIMNKNKSTQETFNIRDKNILIIITLTVNTETLLSATQVFKVIMADGMKFYPHAVFLWVICLSLIPQGRSVKQVFKGWRLCYGLCFSNNGNTEGRWDSWG